MNLSFDITDVGAWEFSFCDATKVVSNRTDGHQIDGAVECFVDFLQSVGFTEKQILLAFKQGIAEIKAEL